MAEQPRPCGQPVFILGISWLHQQEPLATGRIQSGRQSPPSPFFADCKTKEDPDSFTQGHLSLDIKSATCVEALGFTRMLSQQILTDAPLCMRMVNFLSLFGS